MIRHADKTQKDERYSKPALQKREATSAFSFVDHKSGAVAQGKLPEVSMNNHPVNRLKAFQEMANNSPQAKQAAQMQAMADNSVSAILPVQKKQNKTGLPGGLKAGIESLSGYTMDDVKVHYNSSKPAQLKAHAYAQGTDIHVAPGQERHLPHEAWHVVQQKQGRVKPTLQLKGNVPVNDDKGLEEEADKMGHAAISQPSLQAVQYRESPLPDGTVAQRMPLENFQTITKQEFGEEYGQFLVYFKNDYEAHERMGAFYTGERMYNSWIQYVQDPAFTEEMLRSYVDHFTATRHDQPLSPVEEFTPKPKEDTSGPPKPWQKGPQKKDLPVIRNVTAKHPVNWAYFERQPLFPKALGSLDKPIQEQVHELDIVQGLLGDCWLLATIGAIAIKSPEDLVQLIQEVTLTGMPTPKRIFKVKIHSAIDQTPIDVLVDSSLPVSIKNGNLVYGGKGKSILDHFSLYLPLIEKAVAGDIGKSAGYDAITSSGARQAFTLLTGQLPEEISIRKLLDENDFQELVARNKDKPMTISGMRKNPPQPDKESQFEPHEMVVLDTNGVNFTIYDQSARPDRRVFETSLNEMVQEMEHAPYAYRFNKLNIAQTSTRTYGDGAALLRKFHTESELYLLQRMEVIPDVIGMFQQLHDIEDRINILEATMELDFGVIEEKLNHLKTLLASYH